MRNALDQASYAGQVPDMTQAVYASAGRPVPYACELIGVVANLSAAVATNVSTMMIVVNYAPTAFTIRMPVGSTGGIFTPSARVFLNAGGSVKLYNLGETTAAAVGEFTLLIRGLKRPVVDGSTIADIGGVNYSERRVVPYDCEVMSLSVELAAPAAGGPTTMNVYVDEADSGVDFEVPSTGNTHTLYPDNRLFLQKGASLRLRSGGETTASPAGYFSWELRPMQTLPAGHFSLAVPGTDNIQTAGDSEAVCVPAKSRLVAIIANPQTTIATAATDGCYFGIKRNGTLVTGADYHLPEGSLPGGHEAKLHAMHSAYFEPGDAVLVTTLGECTASTSTTYCLVFEALGDNR